MTGQTFEDKFRALCIRLSELELGAHVGPKPQWPNRTHKYAVIKRLIDRGDDALPWIYDESYVQPLRRRLRALVRQLRRASPNKKRRHDKDPRRRQPLYERLNEQPYRLLEALAGAVYEHAPSYRWTPHLRRFLAVVSDRYRSFLRAAEDLSSVDGKIPVEEVLPPLATFRYPGGAPFTYPVDEVRGHVPGASVAVVSVPAFFAKHPIFWAWLAHETGGHDVIHAVRSKKVNLLSELCDGVKPVLKETRVPNLSPRKLEAFWSYWMNEAAADVYGVLNVGPNFGIGMAATLAAVRHQMPPNLELPRLLMTPDSVRDKYPTDILRIHLVLGAVRALNRLNVHKRRYVKELSTLAKICATGQDVTIAGLYRRRPFTACVPLRDMQKCAQRVGRYLVTARFKALGNRSIRDVETWDDRDERAAIRVSEALGRRRAVDGLGDDAQLLAGAIMRVLDEPKDYTRVNKALADAFDKSFAQDPVWREVAQRVRVRVRRR